MRPEDQEYVNSLYHETYDMLKLYAHSMLFDMYCAEELTQEVFVTAMEKTDELRSSPNPRGWLYNTLRHKILNYNRTTTNRLRLVADYVAVNGDEITMHIDPEDLPLKYGRLAKTEEFQLIYDMAVMGMNHEELAQIRGISVVTCRKRVERAKKYLRKKLQNQLD